MKKYFFKGVVSHRRVKSKKHGFDYPYRSIFLENIYDFQALMGQKKFKEIQSKKNTFYTGAYLGYGFHEDGIKSSQAICELINSRDI